MKSIFYYQTDLGQIGIAEEGNKITNVFLRPDICQMQDAELNKNGELKDSTVQNSGVNSDSYCLKETDILKEAISQLYEYLQGKRQVFSIPLAPYGTEFMKSVWKCLCDIPYGETKSYKDIAKAIGNEKACRVVGQANNRNPIPIFIPCHRVIGKNGSLIGYNSGLQVKKLLLEIEKQYGNI